MRTDLFDFDLPDDRIALRPAVPRDAARLLVVRPQRAVDPPHPDPLPHGEREKCKAVPVLEDRTIADLPGLLRPGDVLVVTTTSESTDGMFGELLAVSARAHGAVGLLIDAGVRDVADLTTMEFPVWSKAISAQGTAKATAGSVNVPVVCAGATIQPGDVIVADVDGVVVVPRNAAAEVARLGNERVTKEEKSRERLRKGELGLDFYGLRAKLTELGVQFVDEG